jgi:hypothetical protein
MSLEQVMALVRANAWHVASEQVSATQLTQLIELTGELTIPALAPRQSCAGEPGAETLLGPAH